MRIPTPARRRTKSPRAEGSPRRAAARPRIELLEERVVLSTITVLTDADAGPGSLRAALAAAESGDVIQFDPGLSGRTIHLTSGELDIDEDLTIQGPGASLLGVDAGGLSRVFDIESPDAAVTISGLTISGGKATMGGGVLVQGGRLTLADAAVVGNWAAGDEPGGSASGGGVAVLEGGSLTATDSLFRDNAAQGARGADGGTARRNGYGGGGYGGAIYTEGSSLTIVGGAFLGNRATGGRGGDGGAGAGTSSTSASNDFGGSASGGGLYVASGSLSISGATLADNQALGGDGGDAVGGPYSRNGVGGSASGGALTFASGWIPDSSKILSNNTFRNNGARGGLNAGTAFQASARGGAIDNATDQLIIDDCDFESNWVESNYISGDSIADVNSSVGGAVASPFDSLVVSRSTFVGNRASGSRTRGGVIFGEDLSVADSTFRDNQATGWFNNGGVIYASASLGLSRSTFTNNAAIAHGDGGGIGGGVIYSSRIWIADCDFDSNTAIGGEGGPNSPWSFGEGGIIYDGEGGGNIFGGVVSNFVLTSSGFFSGELAGQFNHFIEGSSFTNNLAKGGDGGQGGNGGDVRGGDIALGGFLSLTNSTFVGTRAIGGDGGDGDSGGVAGAGGKAIGGSLSIVYPFTGSVDGTEYSTGPILIDGTTFRSVTAQGGRGGDGTLGGNGGDALGGAIAAGTHLYYARGRLRIPLTISNSLITGAVARGGDAGRNGDGGDARGGAIFLGGIGRDEVPPSASINIAATLTNVSILNNTAQGGRGKGAGRGGDGLGGGVFADRYSRIFLSRGAIAGNRAIGGLGGRAGLAGAGVGGGVYLTTGGSVLGRTLIVRNQASTLDDDVHGSFG